MLSRRNVRIKVMQLLFALNRDEELTFTEANKKYWDGIDNTYRVYLFCFYNLIEVTKRAEHDAQKRKSKHLPSEQDKAFTAILYSNKIINSAVENKKLQGSFQKEKCLEKTNTDYHQTIYNEFLKEESYQNFINGDKSDDKIREILLELFRFCRKSELFNEMLEDHYPCWLDDKSVVIGALKKTLKALPADNDNFFEMFKPDDETVQEFGEKLLQISYEKSGDFKKDLLPILENWDHDRLAIVDTILIEMALAEFLEFKTIPTKVTLNEYVEVAKNYSTAKSKEFINGILDKLLKKMDEEGRINKEGRGLLT